MKIVLDTNVLISGIFFSGPPYQILKAWRQGKMSFVVAEEILSEEELEPEDEDRQYLEHIEY